MTKIVHIEDWFNPETGYQINYLAKYHSHNVDFHVITSDSFDLWPDQDFDFVKKQNDPDFAKKYNVSIHRLPSSIKGKKHNRWLQGLEDLVYNINPDIVFVHCLESFTALRVLLNPKMRKRFKLVSDTHTLYSQFGSGVGYGIYTQFIKRIVVPIIKRNKIQIFYTAEENKNILKNTYGIPEELIKNSTIGSDLSSFYYSQEERKLIREKYRVPDDAFLLIYTGKFNNLKQPHLLLEAFQALKHYNIYVMFVGAKNIDYYDKYFLQTVSENKNIRVLESQKNTELYKFYSAADLAVFPRQNTLSALDSQACKLPVIMEEDDTNRIRLQHGGLLFQSGNIAELSQKIEQLYNDRAKLNKLSDEGYKFITSNYDYQKIIEGVEKIILQDLKS